MMFYRQKRPEAANQAADSSLDDMIHHDCTKQTLPEKPLGRCRSNELTVDEMVCFLRVREFSRTSIRDLCSKRITTSSAATTRLIRMQSVYNLSHLTGLLVTRGLLNAG